MLFDDDFIRGIKDDPIAKVKVICRITKESLDPNGQGWTSREHDVLLEAYLLLEEISLSDMLPFSINPPSLPDRQDLTTRCITLFQYVESVEESCNEHAEQLKIEQLRSRLRGSLGVAFAYEFSRGDLERIQVLINELRELLSKADDLEYDHRRRLLKRLEALQSELHKRMSDLDRFWGMVGDAGVVLGKLGKDAKPIVDRIKEIADIVWQTQRRAEELPSSAKPPQIGHDSNSAE